MVIDVVVVALCGLAGFAVDLLPVSSTDVPALTGLVPWYGWLNGFLPVSEALSTLGIVVTAGGVVLLFRMAWTVKRVVLA